MAGGYLYLLAVGAHALADLDRAGLALAGPGAELLFAPLDPQLVLVGQVVALNGGARTAASSAPAMSP